MNPRPSDSPPDGVAQRDEVMARLGRARRGLIFAVAGLTAGFSGLVAAIAPGKSSTPQRSTAARGVRTAGPVAAALPALYSAQSLGLHAPAPKPRAASSSGPDASASSAAAGAAARDPAAAAPAGPPAPPPAPAVTSGGS